MIKPASEVKHTAGALRAAHTLIGDDGCRLYVHDEYGRGGWEDEAHIAELISRETRDAELLEALQEIVDAADQSNGGKGAELPWSLHVREIAATALRKAAKEGR